MFVALLLVTATAVLECPPGTSLDREESNGTEWLICEARDGVREGPMLFVVDGRVASRTQYRRGLRQGEARSFYRNGVASVVERFQADAPHGLQERFLESGRKVYEQEMRTGRAHGALRRWRDDGTPLVVSEWRDGEPVSFTTFHANGAVRATAAHGLPDSVVVERDERGGIVKTTTVADGILAGSINDDSFDDGQLSCPVALFDRVSALGVGYPTDRCGGPPRLVGGRMETYAWAPRSSRAALAELGCTFTASGSAEEHARASVASWFHSLASVGE